MFFALSLIMSAMRVEGRSEEQQVSTVGNENGGDELNEQLKKEEISEYKWEEKLTVQNEVLDSETVMPIHPMKVQLPLENWHDLLAFVPRSQLGNAVSEIGDYQFASIIQSFLHDEVRKITLGEMRIISPRRYIASDKPMVHVWPNNATNMPDWPMPGNIKDFKAIELSYVNTSILNFLGNFQQNSLLTNVNMLAGQNFNEDIQLRFFAKILPLISSIDSIEYSGGIDLFEMAYNNNTNDGNSHESQLLLKGMMAQMRVILIYGHTFGTNGEDKMDWICSWLYTPRNDGKPRMLRLHIYAHDVNNVYASLTERIKQDYNEANHAVSFFIHAIIFRNNNIEDNSFENVKTNEKLVIKIANHGVEEHMLIIWRYPRKAAKNWIEANEKEITEWDSQKLDRKIIMENDLRIAI